MSKTFIFIILFVLSSNLIGQITNIPDPKFEQALIDQGIDSDGTINGQVFTSDVDTLTELELALVEIEDLTGIEDFVSLTSLDVSHNFLTSLDLSSLTLLEYLNFGNPSYDIGVQNDISEIDLSNNTELKWLFCSFTFNLGSLSLINNQKLETLYASNCSLTSLDISNNTLLEVLEIDSELPEFSNNLPSLDVSNHPTLNSLKVGGINLSHLNVKNGNNIILTDLRARENPNLVCIQVDNEAAATNGEPPYDGWFVDETTSYSEDCSLGVYDVLLENSISIYPNPVEDIIHLRNDSFAEINQVSFYNMNGRVIHVKELKALTFDLSSLQSGVYFVKIEMDKGSLTKKVVKE